VVSNLPGTVAEFLHQQPHPHHHRRLAPAAGNAPLRGRRVAGRGCRRDGGGDEPRAIAGGATDTGFPLARTGIITTATGLLFQAGLDRKLRAYDAETGRVLWTGELPGGSVGIPAMYEADGKQYVLVSATQGGRAGGAGAQGRETAAAPAAEAPRAYVAFALP